jgi:hypothetical protein
VVVRTPRQFIVAREPRRVVSVRTPQRVFVSRAGGVVLNFGGGSGFSNHVWDADGQMVPNSKNRITQPNTTLQTPPFPGDFSEFVVTVEAGLAGCSIEASAGQTIDFQASADLTITPISVRYQYNATDANWFQLDVRT